MSINKQQRDKFLREAKVYEDMRDSLGRTQLDNFKFLKGQVADWHIAIAAVCFAIGGISISLAGNDIKHPALFWWGSVLLIANGVFVFFIRKTELDGEFSGFPNLKQKEADLWTMAKVAREHADGDTGRADEFKVVAERFSHDYDERSKPFKWWHWVKYVVLACMLDVVFGFLLFPILMLAPQLPNHIHITFRTYTWTMWTLVSLYAVYVILQAIGAVRQKRKSDAADRQIKDEVDGVR